MTTMTMTKDERRAAEIAYEEHLRERRRVEELMERLVWRAWLQHRTGWLDIVLPGQSADTGTRPSGSAGNS